ncbi:MAG: GyrI-like domain-containing protein [Firmicutes bacterium]|nr:GyrI-like domain-containing protein [Bacillota bacterium]
MAELVRVYRESLPKIRLVGKRYTNQDRDQYGGFGHKWGEWFQNGYFIPLDQLTQLPDEMNGYIGCMRMEPEFEYWIGVFTTDETQVPEGYDYVDIPAGDIAVCLLKGREDTGELYGMDVHTLCERAVEEQGWEIDYGGWFFERYNCPRFTDPDEEGRVILDYCFYLR